MTHKIAIIIPVYNAKRYLRQCIDSVLKQVFLNWELVLVDDGSTDGSGQICNEFAEKDSRIKVIHQSNMGSVVARKNGVLSEYAQSAKYVFLSDADDVIEATALQKLYDEAESNDLDCVAAQTIKMWRGIKLYKKHCVPCFRKARLYSNQEILDEVYISCFGISDYPVTLYAKLYRTELLTKSVVYPPIVHFMGDDLSVTLRLLPETNKLGIISDVIYQYRIGGNSSRFMPYMLDDFLALYRFKAEMRIKHPMPQDAEYLMAVEMLNILMSWFEMYKKQGKHTNTELLSEIERAAKLPEVRDSLRVMKDRNKPHCISGFLENEDYAQISVIITEKIKRNYIKGIIKQVIYSI